MALKADFDEVEGVLGRRREEQSGWMYRGNLRRFAHFKDLCDHSSSLANDSHQPRYAINGLSRTYTSVQDVLPCWSQRNSYFWDVHLLLVSRRRLCYMKH